MPRQIASLSAAAILTVFAAGAIDTDAQSGPGRGAQPPPPGQRIQVNDGDVVVIEGDARVRIVRRRAANVRAIYDQDQQWFLVLADYVPPKGGKPNGTVDATYMFRALQGNWPFDARWEGPVVIEDYVDTDFPPVSGGVGIVFPFGLVQFFAMPKSPDLYVMSSAVAVLRYGGGGRSGGVYESFDLAEARQVENLRRVTQINAGLARGSGSGFIRIETVPPTGTPSPPQQSVQPSGEQAPIRVGGSVRPPQRIHYVEAAYPDLARQAGISGIVILEIIIGTDGTVTSAKVLRSPDRMFDQPAIDAVTQWRYEPTTLDGKPVPVITTVTVDFSR